MSYTSIGFVSWDSTKDCAAREPAGKASEGQPRVWVTRTAALRFGPGDDAREVFVRSAE